MGLVLVTGLLFLCPTTLRADTRASGWLRGRDLTWSPMAKALNPNLKYHAIVIGINKYKRFRSGQGWGSLDTARHDAEAVARTLEQKYGFKVTTLVDTEATRDAIMKALDQVIYLDINDAVTIYYAGHGYYQKELSEGFWIPSDARRVEGQRLAKEDWLWNSTITKMLGASKARHIMVVADSCYSGSLFRGEEESSSKRKLAWYKRVNARPSRYLITSGDLEPVLDSGGQHSIFAQHFLNALNYPENPIFSASDIGHALREKVSAMTGQQVRMGALAVSSHAGGEFVFLHKDALLPKEVDGTPSSSGPVRGGSEPQDLQDPPPPERSAQTDQEILEDALLLSTQGAKDTAQALISGLVGSEEDPNPMVKAVAYYMNNRGRSEKRQRLQGLIDRLERTKVVAHSTRQSLVSAQPRVVSCLGPRSRLPGDKQHTLALLYRITLTSELEQQGGLHVVEREALEDLLQEMDLGVSELSDERAKLTVGRLLPASLVLVGDLISTGQSNRVYLRMIDTETTRVVGSFSAVVKKEDDLYNVCQQLSQEIVAKASKTNPLIAQATYTDAQLITARVGRFHGAHESMEFSLVERTPTSKSDFQETDLGQVEVVRIEEERSLFRLLTDLPKTQDSLSRLWIRERSP